MGVEIRAEQSAQAAGEQTPFAAGAPRPLRVVERPAPASIPADATEFLRGLGGPVAIRVPGRARDRCRTVVTLMHGNEPSGARAIHGWLRDGLVPTTDTLLILASVETALAEPPFTHRQLPGAPDLNRLFGEPGASPGAGPGASPDPSPHGRLARAVLAAVLAARPEALLDIHNNSGHNPAYGVARRTGTAERTLCGLFGGIVVRYDLRLGALIEVTADGFPSVVIECGRAGDPAADAVARSGLDRFLGEDDLLQLEPPAQRVLVDPVRVEALPGVVLAFGSGPGPGFDLVVDEEIDRHNFESMPAGAALGWLRPGAPWPLRAIGAEGRDCSRELFAVEGERVVARRALIPIMMTTDPRIAVSDCLFYAVVEEATVA